MEKKPNINVGGLGFSWELEEGRFLFENEDAVLFWISSAMKSFFDTIEEVSGEEAANLVMESTGFRQGSVVGDYFNRKEVGIDQVAEILPNTYASAGWGKALIENVDKENLTLEVRLTNDWEHKINKAQGKEKRGSFLPAHYAGIFSGLFGRTMWYEVQYSQLEGHDCTLIEYFPAEVDIEHNIHDLARRKEAEQIVYLEGLVEDKTRDLKELVKTLSSPIIPVLEGIVVVPLLGRYDEERADELITKTLTNLPEHKASYLVLDLTGLDNDLTKYTASLIEKMGTAASLIGTKVIIVGISAELGRIISQTEIDLSKFECFQNLQHGIHYALAQNGRRIV
ncbi:STAS domain-containing protein [Thalassobacillus devorans]|uniref:STAS domain-containing protein n=1 Tax=Thalassobacillus devorans TaxID=279813 RepID=UPI000A1C8B01|nr:STAS domain-containing protein [Thalassobacillus devorans]